MIQRVQTLFLLAVSILTFTMLVSPLSSIILPSDEIVKFYSYGLKNISQGNELIRYTFPLIVLIIISFGISFSSIFLYKKRPVQLKLCVYNILLQLLIIGIITFYYFSIKHQLNWESNSLSLVIIFPVINIVLTFQAFRAIGRDEHLVKSYDRLR